MQKTVQSRSNYSARGEEPPPPWLRALGQKMSRGMALSHRSWKKLVSCWWPFGGSFVCRVSKNACGGSTTGSHNISRLHEAIPEGVRAGGEEQRWRGQVDVSANRAAPPSSAMMPMSLKHKMKIAFRASRRLRHPTVARQQFSQDKSCSKHSMSIMR